MAGKRRRSVAKSDPKAELVRKIMLGHWRFPSAIRKGATATYRNFGIAERHTPEIIMAGSECRHCGDSTSDVADHGGGLCMACREVMGHAAALATGNRHLIFAYELPDVIDDRKARWKGGRTLLCGSESKLCDEASTKKDRHVNGKKMV